MQTNDHGLTPALLAELRRHGLLHALLKARIVEDAVSAIELTGQEQEQALQQQRQRHGIADADAESRFLVEHQVNRDDWCWQAELPFRVRHYAQRTFRMKAENRFLETKDRLDRVVYSLLRVQDAFLAQELYLRISGGEADFAQLAEAFAEGPERNSRGVVGPVPLTKAHPALAERLRRSKPGDLLAPFRIEQWWLVARLESMTAATFSQATAERMCLELFEAWSEAEAFDTMKRLSTLGD